MRLNLLVALGGNNHNLGAARTRFLQITYHFVVNRPARCNSNHREAIGNKRNWPVFHFARRVRFRVQVANLLKLERAFVAGGSAHTAPNEQSAGGVYACARRLVNGRGVGQNLFHLRCRFCQLAEKRANFRGAHAAFCLRQQHGQKR